MCGWGCLVWRNEDLKIVFLFSGFLQINESETETARLSNDERVGGTVQVSRDKKGVRRLFRDFAQNTTLHGFSRAAKERSEFNKYGWKNVVFLAAILSCLGLTGHNLYFLISDYLRFPVTTSIVVENHQELEFPAVTICNCNKQPTEAYYENYNDTVSTKKNISVVKIMKIKSTFFEGFER